MTHALAPRMARGIRALPYAAFTAVIAIALGCAAGIAFAEPGSGQALPIEAHAWAQADDTRSRAAAAPRRTRCTGCGVVEDIAPLEIVANQPAQFRFTVRMRDRSVRVSRSVGRARWNVGDRIMLMGGAGASAD